MNTSKTAAEVTRLLRTLTENQIFGVTFIKRSDGKERNMQCRFGVRKGLTGHGQSYQPAERELVCVYDMQKQGYRMIPLEGITRLTINGTTYNFPLET